MPNNLSTTLFVILMILNAVPLAALNMFLPSLGIMASDLGVDYDKMAWAISGYLLLTAVIMIFSGQAADRIGRRPVLIVCLCLFAVSSIGCALSEDFAVFMVFRVLQGAIITGSVLSRAIVSDAVGKQKAASVLGYMAMAMSLSPILGPVIGGLIGEYYGWRAIFWVYAGMGVLLLLLVFFWLPETRRSSETEEGVFLENYLKLLKSALFWAHTLVMSLGIGAFFIFASGIPLVAASEFSLNQFEIGLAMGSIACGFLVGSFISGRISTKFTPETMILTGRILASLGLFLSTGLVLAGWLNLWTLLGGIVFVGLGNGLTIPGASASVMYVEKDLSASASGLSGAAVFVLGAALTTLAGIVLDAYPSALALLTLMCIVTTISLVIAIWIMSARIKVNAA